MPASTSRSPSPAAAPPVATAPGPRAVALQKLYSDAIAHTLKTCNYKNFASCFPTPAKHAPAAMKGLHADFTQKLDHLCRDNFDIVLKDRAVIPSLNDLDRLVEDARKRKARAEEQAAGQPVNAPIPPHTLPPSSLYLSHLAPSLAEQRAALEARLNAAQTENADLLQTVLQQRRTIESLVSGLENVVADLDASNAALPHEEMLTLSEDAVNLDMEIQTNG